jgi:hypothetical protein
LHGDGNHAWNQRTGPTSGDDECVSSSHGLHCV